MTSYDSAFTRPPAPPPLDLVQAFLNSVDLEDGADALATIESLGSWTARHVPEAGSSFTETDRQRIITVREILRDMVEGDSGGDASRALKEQLRDIPLSMLVTEDGGMRLVSMRDGIDAILARVMMGVYHAMIDGSWKRLKICRNDTCRWAFYDASKNHSGVWCSMATCGSKAKARAYRSRARHGPVS